VRDDSVTKNKAGNGERFSPPDIGNLTTAQVAFWIEQQIKTTVKISLASSRSEATIALRRTAKIL